MTNYLDPARLGEAKHELIGALLVAGVRSPSTAEKLAWSGRKASEQRVASPTRTALRTRYLAALTRYFACCVPPADWEFVDREVPVPGGRIDLLWRTPLDRLVGQELKTSELLKPLDGPDLLVQVSAQLAGAIANWGDRFGGILVHHLAAPDRAFFVDRDNNHHPLKGVKCLPI